MLGYFKGVCCFPNMLRRHRQVRTQLSQLLDASLFALALWVAHLIRSSLPISVFGGTAEIGPFSDYVWLYLVVLPLAPITLEMQGFYRRTAYQSPWKTLWRLLRASGILTICIIAAIFLFRRQDLVARSVVLIFGLIGFVFVGGKELFLHFSSRRRLSGSQSRRRFLLVGAPEDTARLRRELETQMGNEVEQMIELDVNAASQGQLVDLLHEHSINGVILSAKHTYFGQVEQVIQLCELEGVEVWLVADFFKTQISRTSLDDLFGRPVLVFRSTPDLSWEAFFKQLIDYVGAGLALLVLGIPLLLTALLIKLTSKGPVLFRQQRSGLNGRPFTMYKFRSMVTNAEQLKQELSVLNEMSGPVFKVTNDPRVTKTGRWLRKMSIDEFPQLINILKGEMSLVGPRPLPVDEVKRFDELAHRRRLSVKPGLTCLWQISGRNNVKDFKEWVRLDLEYIDNWSIWLDLKILWLTIPVVLFQKGAK
jgi:exopolysaccharide biosynthesis polyprenyl glycosylphosphotransferase